MNKTELITAVAEEAGVTKKEAEKVLKALSAAITTELKNGGRVQLPEIGSFKVAERKERQVRNPRTQEIVTSAACKAAKFVPAKALKDAVNE